MITEPDLRISDAVACIRVSRPITQEGCLRGIYRTAIYPISISVASFRWVARRRVKKRAYGYSVTTVGQCSHIRRKYTEFGLFACLTTYMERHHLILGQELAVVKDSVPEPAAASLKCHWV